MDYRGKHILIVGLGKTGVALSRFLAARGARVTVTDPQPAAALSEALAELQDLPLSYALGLREVSRPDSYDVIIPSPGVPPELPWLQRAVAAGVPLIGELEVASQFLAVPVAAITGTNGKTTTTTLVGHLLAAAGQKVLVGGNIGTPLISLVDRQAEVDCLVIEVSSFQLDTAVSFRPRAAALLNITDDHLDRYPDFAAYARSKASLFRCQGPADVAVLNLDDPHVAPLAGSLKSPVYPYSLQQTLTVGGCCDGPDLVIRRPGVPEARFPLADIRLPGRHNHENVLAALLVALEMGAPATACRQVLSQFAGLPHRVEWVAAVDGVDFYDDSKGTNVGAVVRALEFFTRPVILIAGGRDKGGDYRPLASPIRTRVKTLVLLGEAKDKMAAALGHLVPTRRAADMAEAIALARQTARPGDVVLLSPACSSFDMYTDYAARGNDFQRAVKGL